MARARSAFNAGGNNFSLQLGAFVQKAKANAHEAVRKIVLEFGTRLVYRSPVGDPTLWSHKAPPGYIGGRFRANWQYGHNTVPVDELIDIDPSGQVTIDKIASQIPAQAAGGVHILVNNLPYAEALENGHSTQAPAGMVHLTVIEFQQAVNTAVAGMK